MRAAPALGLVLALALPAAARAQEDDRSYLTAFLEDNLSSAGRTVTITGFEGALSSRATMDRITIADDQGVWITLDEVVLDWSRSSLLTGEIAVKELSAEQITVDRLPVAPSDGALPTPEAAEFALPDLPVSIEVGSILAERIVLGEAVLGEPVEGRFEASMTLAEGEGKAALVLERTDGPQGRIALDASYANATGVLALDLDATEAAGGIAAQLLDLPGEPAITLKIAGTGPLSAFAAEVRLASDGVDRLAGPITITREADGAHLFNARLTGNLAPLFLPDYAAFLGDSVALELTGRRWDSGRLALDGLVMRARALDLRGTATLAADGLPEAFSLAARIAAADGQPVPVPLPGDGRTRLRAAEVTLSFDAARDQGWTGRATLAGLEHAGLTLDRAEVKGSGRIGRRGGTRSIGATLDFTAGGIALADAALQRALGADLSGTAVLHWQDGRDALHLPRLELRGQDFTATAGLRLEGLTAGLRGTGSLALSAQDLSRFAGLAGLPLTGSGEARLTGWASPLSGEFDLVMEATTQGLGLGIAEADRLLAGDARLTVSALRDDRGISLRAADLAAGGLAASLAGQIASAQSDLSGQVSLASLATLDPGWGGALTARARLTGTPEDGTLTLDGEGANLALGQPEVDRLLRGTTAVHAVLGVKDRALLLREARLDGAELQAEARGQEGSDALRVTGSIRDLGLILPGFPGQVTLSGQATPGVAGSTLDLRLTGPAAIEATIAGQVAPGRADLTIRGGGNAAVLNPLADPLALAGALRVDLALQGAPALSSLSGRVTLSGGQIAIPFRGLSLGRAEAVIDLQAGRAQVAATAEVDAGGRLRIGGSVGLALPFDAALDITQEAVRLRDPELYDTTVSGQLRLTGPLAGRALLAGRVQLGKTDLVVPSTGFAAASDIRAIRHVDDSAAVRETRARAGLNGNGTGAGGSGSAGGPDWALDVLIDAPNRIFLRGRGLDAELGGSVLLGGSLGAVSPSGAIELIRGRLDLLGKRLELSEARLVLEGDLVPFLKVVASNETDGVVSMVTIEGPATAPEVSFSSVPEMPEEEVLAWLLFGRGLDSISALQALQLANAVAVLAGRGGEGMIAKLRKSFGFDDLDISAGEDGTASVSAGKYLTKNIYSEIEVDQDGQSQINLNLDLRKGVTVKGRIGTDGQSGIGVFLERDY